MIYRLSTISLLWSLTGCASLIHNGIGFQTGSPTPYAGVRDDLDDLSNTFKGPRNASTTANGLVAFVDLPFSAALDTVLLPFFIPEAYRELVAKARTKNEELSQSIHETESYAKLKKTFDRIEYAHLERTVGRTQMESIEISEPIEPRDVSAEEKVIHVEP